MNIKSLGIVTICIALFAAWLYAKNESLVAENHTLISQNESLNESITRLSADLSHINLTLEQNNTEIQKVLLKSNINQRELRNALKNSICATTAMPDDVIKWLQQHANQIRASTNTEKLN